MAISLHLPKVAMPLGSRRQEIDVHLSKIDSGVAWVSSYWGYNAPKLVYDGESYYTVAAVGTGASPRLRGRSTNCATGSGTGATSGTA